MEFLYKVATIQFNSQERKVDENNERLVKLCREAAENGAKLIVTPEMATTGIGFKSRQEIAPYLQEVPGPTTSLYEEVTREFDCYIVVGLPEIDPKTDVYYNTSVLIGPDGIVGKYRKTHLYAPETRWAAPGNTGLPVFDTDIGKIGCLICMDYIYFEPARIMALQAADVLVNISAWNIEKCPAPTWFSRAWENGVYVIASNRSDKIGKTQFSGGSAIINPDGSIQQYIDAGEGTVLGEIDLNVVQKERKTRFEERKKSPYLVNQLLHMTEDRYALPKGKKAAIAAFQFEPIPLNREENFAKIEQAANDAANERTKLLVLPELAITGVVKDRPTAENFAVELPECEEITRLTEIAKQNQLMIVLGLIEKEQDHLFNTIVMVDENGLHGKYRKVHLNEYDLHWANPGQEEFPFFDTELGRIGLLSGDDCKYGESAMSLAVQSVDIITASACVSGPKPVPLQATEVPLSSEETFLGDDDAHWHLWRARAVETNTFIAFANQSGKAGMGCSGVFGPYDWPREEKIACNNEELVIYEVDTSSANDDFFPNKKVRVKENVRSRIPHLYHQLV